jgi:hypothetical protein
LAGTGSGSGIALAEPGAWMAAEPTVREKP